MFKLLQKFWVGEVSDAINKRKKDVKLSISHRAVETANFGTVLVCGDENSGKSITLQRLLQEEIFEVGDDLVTRAPLRIKLIYTPDAKRKKMILTIPGKPIITTFNAKEVYDTLKQNHDAIQQSGVGISPIEAKLEIFSNTVPNVDIIDLPGVMSFPADGEPDNLPVVVKDIVAKYIAIENCIILNIIDGKANQRNSPSAGLLKDVNPAKIIKVFTKVDCLRDERQPNGPLSQFLEKFNKEEKAGYKCVALSNYKSDERDTFDMITKAEMKFFQDNLDYNTMSHKVGINIVLQHINHLAEESTRQEWAIAQKETEEKNLNQLKTDLINQGPELTTDELIHEVYTALVKNDPYWDQFIAKCWANFNYQLPSESAWTDSKPIDMNLLIGLFKHEIAVKTNEIFASHPKHLYRYSSFQTEFLILFCKRVDELRELYLRRWGKIAKKIWLDHDSSLNYNPEQWFKGFKYCLISMILMQLDNEPSLESNLKKLMGKLSNEENAMAKNNRDSLKLQIKTTEEILQMLPAKIS